MQNAQLLWPLNQLQLHLWEGVLGMQYWKKLQSKIQERHPQLVKEIGELASRVNRDNREARQKAREAPPPPEVKEKEPSSKSSALRAKAQAVGKAALMGQKLAGSSTCTAPPAHAHVLLPNLFVCKLMLPACLAVCRG